MTRRLRCCDLVTALLLVLITARPVHAGCTVSSSGLAFGTYQSLTFAGKLSSADVSSAGIVSVVCSGIATGGDYTIALGPSMAGSGDRISTRYLANPNGGELMMFNLYTDYNRSTVWGDGTARREILYVDDLADAMKCLMTAKVTDDLFNVGCGHDLSIAELAALIAEVVGFEGRIVYDLSKPNGTMKKLLDSSRIRAIGWRPKIDEKTGLQSAYSDFQALLNSQTLSGRL